MVFWIVTLALVVCALRGMGISNATLAFSKILNADKSLDPRQTGQHAGVCIRASKSPTSILAMRGLSKRGVVSIAPIV